jgi:hypothetical protein
MAASCFHALAKGCVLAFFRDAHGPIYQAALQAGGS